MSTVIESLPAANAGVMLVDQVLTYDWSYETRRAKLTRLYEHAKRDQWDGGLRLDWAIDVDPESELLPDQAIGIHGTPMWDALTPAEKRRLRHEFMSWQISQYLHGEQGALLAAAQLVSAVPFHEGKQFGATQVVDEARHVEVFRRFTLTKLEHEYPVNPALKQMLDSILADSRWDMKLLGMQVLIEGLALAAFGTMRATAQNALLRDLTASVMEDEARHVAFGVLTLRELYADLTERDRMEREEFVYEACVLMRDRILNREVWEAMGMDADACLAAVLASPMACEFRRRLFSNIVPNVKRLGLLSDKQRGRFAELGILEYAMLPSSDPDEGAPQ